MSFKEEVAADLDGVFFAGDEFADYHTVEGARILCIIDTDKGERKSDGSEYDLAEADFVLIAKTADLPARKEAGSLLNLDGRELTVSEWNEQNGATIVGLYSAVTA